jgi:dihydropteroate synthase
MIWQTSRFDIDLQRPRIMGIVNVTPDSFSDGGRHSSASEALAHAEQLLREGADILDVGGESTRPGAPVVSLEEELARVLPVVRGALAWGVPISVDTYKAEVMQAALDAGADIVNDVWALRQNGALAVVAQHPRCGVCLMHMHRDPQTMQVAPMQGEVIEPVKAFLRERAQVVRDAGVADSRIVLDPGIGFGKTVEQNFELLSRQSALLDMGLPILAGWSRKSSLGSVTGQSVAADRVVASVAAAVLALERGARVLRVHDVAPTVQAAAVWRAALAR